MCTHTVCVCMFVCVCVCVRTHVRIVYACMQANYKVVGVYTFSVGEGRKVM